VVRCEGQRDTALYPNLVLAQEGEAKLKKELKERVEAEKQPIIPTLNHVWLEYLLWAKDNKKPRSWITDSSYYQKHIKPRFGDRALDSITPFDLERLKGELKKAVTDRGKPYAAQTIKHILIIIRRLYNLAAKWNLHQGPNPIKGVQLPRVDNQVTEFLTEEELSRLLEVLDNWPFDDSAAFVKFALLTGFRKGEICKLQWSHVDFEHSMVRLEDPKGKKSATIPISDHALEVLKGLERNSDFCFPGKNGQQRTDFKHPWLRIRKQAGLPEEIRFHGLRHHFASTLVSNGVDLAVVRELLTHKDLSMTLRYSHLQPGVLKAAAQKAGDLLTPKKPSKVLPLEKHPS
jgi:integrase